jgi:hypothetical protein
MKISPKILSIPPYISTGWNNISTIHLRTNEGKPVLTIILQDGVQVEIPNMAQSDIDEIFQAHANFSEGENFPSPHLMNPSFSLGIPIKPDGITIESFASQMQHNPEQADLPPIPLHILDKIKTIIRSFGLEDAPLLEKADPGCHCVYCQLSRSLEPQNEEVVEEADLKFRDWEVSQLKEKLYHVINPLDKNEYYDVFLGEPIGCTCGCKNCEHIRAVLNT